MLSQPDAENEWDYDVPDRVLRAVNAFDTRDSLTTRLHLRWQIDALLQVVKIINLTVPELAAMVAILAPAASRLVTNEWDYGVVERVTDAVDNTDTRDGYLRSTPDRLHAQILELMTTVKMTQLSVPELGALLAVLAPANGRRLLADTFEEALRPILRLVDNGADFGDAALQLAEQLADLPDDLTCAD
jgi:hypothetical protein